MTDIAAPSTQAEIDEDPFFFKVLYHVPLLGWLFKDAVHGRSDAKYYFCANVIGGWAMAIAVFGYPAIIVPALCLVFLAFCWVIGVCR